MAAAAAVLAAGRLVACRRAPVVQEVVSRRRCRPAAVPTMQAAAAVVWGRWTRMRRPRSLGLTWHQRWTPTATPRRHGVPAASLCRASHNNRRGRRLGSWLVGTPRALVSLAASQAPPPMPQQTLQPPLAVATALATTASRPSRWERRWGVASSRAHRVTARRRRARWQTQTWTPRAPQRRPPRWPSRGSSSCLRTKRMWRRRRPPWRLLRLRPLLRARAQAAACFRVGPPRRRPPVPHAGWQQPHPVAPPRHHPPLPPSPSTCTRPSRALGATASSR